MSGLVEQLQADANDPAVPVSTLLRKVKLAPVKLKLDRIEDWVDLELSGYTASNVPSYRRKTGSPKALNPYQGWIPIHAPHEMMDELAKASIGQSIPSLEDLLRTPSQKSTFYFPYSAEQIDKLNVLFESNLPQMGRAINRSQIAEIVDQVRTLVLDWALELERQGIMGSGISFDDREKARAQDRQVIIHIGSIGAVTGALAANADGDNARINIGADDQSLNRGRT